MNKKTHYMSARDIASKLGINVRTVYSYDWFIANKTKGGIHRSIANRMIKEILEKQNGEPLPLLEY